MNVNFIFLIILGEILLAISLCILVLAIAIRRIFSVHPVYNVLDEVSRPKQIKR